MRRNEIGVALICVHLKGSTMRTKVCARLPAQHPLPRSD